MPAYILVDITINDPQTYERYKLLAPASIAAYHGKYLVRGGRTEVLEGDWEPSRLVILEFPGVEEAKAWWESRSTPRPRRCGSRAPRPKCSWWRGFPGRERV